MNYQAHYDKLIDKARNRNIAGYVEKHHIIPKCLGGSDAADNIVKLTPEEHYVAHQLLVKIYPKNYKLAYAANMLTVSRPNQQRNNKAYGWIKRHIASVEKPAMPKETRDKISAATKGRIPHNKGTGKPKAEKKPRTAWNKGIKGVLTQSAASNIKRSAKIQGQKRTQSTCNNITLAMIESHRQRKIMKSFQIDF